MKTYTYTPNTQKYSSLKFLLACVVFSTIFLTSCTTVPYPGIDRTPPTVKLNLLGEHVTVTSGGTQRNVNLDISDRHSLVVTGIDEDGGVQRVWIEGTVTCRCTVEEMRDGTMHVRALVLGPAAHNSDGNIVVAEPGDRVKTKLVDTLNFPEDALEVCRDCPPDGECRECTPDMTGYHFRATYTGHADNFRGGSVTTQPLILEIE